MHSILKKFIYWFNVSTQNKQFCDVCHKRRKWIKWLEIGKGKFEVSSLSNPPTPLLPKDSGSPACELHYKVLNITRKLKFYRSFWRSIQQLRTRVLPERHKDLLFGRGQRKLYDPSCV